MHQRISVGRSKGNVVRLTDQNVSRRHARLIRRNGKYLVEDLTSYLGTRVNGAAISAPTVLVDGDQVCIGDYKLSVKTVRAAGAEVVPPALATASRRSAIRAWVRAASDRSSTWASRLAGVAAASVRALSPANVAALASPLPMNAAGAGGDGSISMGLPMVGGDSNLPPSRATPAPTAGGPGSSGASPHLGAPPLEGPLRAARRARLHGTLLLAGVAVVMATVGALFAPLVKKDGKEDGKEAAAPTAPAPVASLPIPESAPPSAAALLQDSKKAFGQQRWADALLLAQRAAALMPGSKEVADFRRAIVAEHQNQSNLQSLKRALDMEDYRAVIRGANGIGANSVYRDRAMALAEAARANLVVQHLTAAEKSRSEGDCRAAQKQAEAALSLEAGNPTAQALISACARAAQTKPRPTAAAVSRRVRVAAAGPPSNPLPAVTRRVIDRDRDRERDRERPAAPPAMAPPSPDKPSRRPIDANNPYAADLP